ncbi:uncharacterized protein DSM5745_08827 [Aspergillus mulundensis]|uniref:DUF6536 domain-containing protein n=1 Tax=Aspergillus mulundensis TaxID=1810919 RepID=A0A3D8R508_9EURO|nr:hypothetical protein DSM5745_08827 [Aspergillus mulundensis]RDW69067.1 hypothetical protein DSM5745_08827 [Aspergillus mulundensis]
MPKVSTLSIFKLITLRRKHDLLPLKDDNVDDTKLPEPHKPGRFAGWKGTLYLGSIAAFTALILNLIMVCWASTRPRHSDEGGSVLYAGDCNQTKHISTGIHLVINILSTGLLSASNYAMQCLSAPTRQDVDRAHAKNKWLDIGVPSARNLVSIPTLRSMLWLCLVASSVPLHLFYNSTVYSTISANGYDVFVANSSFTSLTPSDVSTVYDQEGMKWDGNGYVSAMSIMSWAQAGNLTRMTPEECISAYATSWQSKHGSVALISSAFNGSMSAIQLLERQLAPWVGDSEEDPFGWICDEQPSLTGTPAPDHRCQYYVGEVKSKAGSSWVVRGYEVEYCLVQKTTEKCTLEFSLPLAIVVITTNLVKAVLIVLASFVLGVAPLLTVGDAIASFLKVPDESTRGRCLLTRDMVLKERRRLLTYQSYSPPPSPQKYSSRRRRRWSSLSTARWIFAIFTSISSIAVTLALLAYGFHRITLTSSTDGIWTSGLAVVDTRTMINTINWPSSLIINTLIANTPQLIFSAFYFTLNSILTTMALSTEWNAFSISRKGLRVSTPPQGSQRTTHFLSLPYRYSIPLLGVSAILHWLMSQSIFLVRVLARDSHIVRFGNRDTTTIGYSPPAIVAGLCVGVLLPLGVLGFGARRFKSGMPVAGSCSLAIAAACHPRVEKGGDGKDGLGIEYARLKWGFEVEAGETGHCTYSASPVYLPGDGELYQ